MCKKLTIITIAFIFFCILSPTISIFIPLSGRIPRCMIVYSVGQAETVKVDINFPVLPGSNDDDYYEISWKNTQSNQIKSQTIRSGRFKRQLSLTQNIIYDLCIQALTYRDYGIVHVQYSANNLFAVNQAQIKVPANLLKSEDVTTSFLSAETIQKNLNAFIKIQAEKTNTHTQIFSQTSKIGQRLLQISIGQLIVIIVAGIFQFYTLWRYLKNKNYV